MNKYCKLAGPVYCTGLANLQYLFLATFLYRANSPNCDSLVLGEYLPRGTSGGCPRFYCVVLHWRSTLSECLSPVPMPTPTYSGRILHPQLGAVFGGRCPSQAVWAPGGPGALTASCHPACCQSFLPYFRIAANLGTRNWESQSGTHVPE